MKTSLYNISYAVYDALCDIPQDEKALIDAALQARGRAYAPYSDFLVGAALLMEDGSIYTGNNQENAAYPSGLCAERVAVYHAAASSSSLKILKIAIAGGARGVETSPPTAPCGACRQALMEYEEKQGSPIRVIFCGVRPYPAVCVDSVGSLLPFSFGRNILEADGSDK